MTWSHQLRRTRVPTAVVAGALLIVCATAMPLLGSAGPAQERSVWEGVYTDAQATTGKEVFIRQCAACHSDQPGETAGEGYSPSLIGEEFTFRWTDSSIAYLFDTISQTMPPSAPASLSPRENAAVTAYLLKINGYPAGEAEIDAADYQGLARIFIVDGPPED